MVLHGVKETEVGNSGKGSHRISATEPKHGQQEPVKNLIQSVNPFYSACKF